MIDKDLLVELISYYENAYEKYKRSEDYIDLERMCVDSGVCWCLFAIFEYKDHGFRSDQYWFETTDEENSVEENLALLKLRIDRLNEYLVQSNPNQLKIWES